MRLAVVATAWRAVADFLTRGGDAAYLFGYGPNVPINQHLACAGQGNMMLWQADAEGQARWPMPAFFGARMMSQDWAQPGQGRNALYRATTTLSDARGVPVIGAYPLRRPDGQWAILLINRGSGAVDAQPVRVLHVKGPKDVGVLQVEPGQFGRQHQRGGESREDQGRQGQ